jgi:hypothetical protein
MLTLRQEQYVALTRDARERYISAVLATLPEVFPDDATVTDGAAMRALVEASIDRAAVYGIRGDAEVTLFVYLAHELGDGFERIPWIAAVLTDSELAPPQKLDAIYARLEPRR